MKRDHLIYLCNALDEACCFERGITSDSPAATQKVMGISSAMHGVGVPVLVLSIGRGRQKGNAKIHPACIKRVSGVPVLYLSFFEFPVLTHLWTMVAVAVALFRLRRRFVNPVLLSYNRLIHYWPGIEFAAHLGYRCFQDLEDGDVKMEGAFFRRLLTKALAVRFNRLCSAGGMLASSVLDKQYLGKRTICCYGVASPFEYEHDWGARSLVVLLSGTLQRTTGAQLFADAIRWLRSLDDPRLRLIEFVVTGMGEMAANLQTLSNYEGYPHVRFLGRVSREDYLRVVGQANVGLALKLPSEDIADTTFPSKVIEFASSGLLLLTTRISDVPQLFQEDGALYLDSENPHELAQLLLWLVDNRDAAARMAMQGQLRVFEACSPEKVGASLKSFFFP